MRFLAATMLSLLAVSGAVAGQSDWTELAPGVRIRLITSDVKTADGKTLAAIELDMPQSTKTYWKFPGETGIPMEMGMDASGGVKGYEVHWPYPRIETKDGFTDFVYYGPTVLPVELTLDESASLWKADLTLGICSDMCVPAQAELTAPLNFAKADAGQGIRINQAVALAPIPWDGRDEPIAKVSYDSTAEALRVTLGSAAIDPQSLIADLGDPQVQFGAPQKSPEENVVLLPLLGGEGDETLAGKTVNFTFLTADGAWSTTQVVGD